MSNVQIVLPHIPLYKNQNSDARIIFSLLVSCCVIHINKGINVYKINGKKYHGMYRDLIS